MRKLHVIIACTLTGVGAAWLWCQNELRRPLSVDEVKGTWESTAEIKGYSHTLLTVNPPTFQMWFRSDMVSPEIMPREGKCEVRDSQLILTYSPRYAGHFGRNRKEEDIWHLLRINGCPVLMRPDAFSTWQKEGKLYDYGILMKGRSPSIKELYQDNDGGWGDPFVHGPNKPG